MRRNLATVAVALLACICAISSLTAQPPPPNPIRYVTADPTGTACGATSIALRTPNGTIYTCSAGFYVALPVAPFLNAAKTGSVVIAFVNSATAASISLGGGVAGACGTHMSYWGLPGYLRGMAVATSTVNSTAPMRANLNWDCSGTFNAALAPSPGGAVVPPAAAAGGFFDASSADYYHEATGATTAFAFTKQGSTATAATVISLAMEFVDDAGAYATLLPGNSNTATTASATTFWSVWGGINQAAEKTAAIPIPVAGTLSKFALCNSTAPTANSTWTLDKNTVASSTTLTILSTDLPGCYLDNTHTLAVVAGDYIDFSVLAGGTTQSIPVYWSVNFTPTSGTSTIVGGAILNTTAGTLFGIPGVAGASAAVASAPIAMPIACAAANLYVVQSVANAGGVTTTFTLEKNGADTTLTGVVNNASGTGAIAVDTNAAHAVSYAKGDLLTLKYVAAGGTTGAMGGWAITCN